MTKLAQVKFSEYKTLQEAEKALSDFSKQGITEFVLHDTSCSKKELLCFLRAVQNKCPNLFVKIPVSIENIDRELVSECQNLFCSLEIPFTGISKKTDNASVFLFDKKKYSGKIL